MELPGGPAQAVADKLIELVRLSQAAGERIKSANAAITRARVNRNSGLAVWSELLASGAVAEHPEGGFIVVPRP
jgi:hypothetical protein